MPTNASSVSNKSKKSTTSEKNLYWKQIRTADHVVLPKKISKKKK